MFVVIAIDPANGQEMCVNGLLDWEEFPPVAGEYPPLHTGGPRQVILREQIGVEPPLTPRECWGFSARENAELAVAALGAAGYAARIQEIG